MELCTVFDSNYIINGLALYESIKNNNLMINILCMDELTFKTLENLKLENIFLYYLKDIEKENRELIKIRDTDRDFLYGDSYSNYCWALTPFFCNYILKNKKIESLLYIDSDIYFYEGFEKINTEIEGYDIGIVTHRHKHFFENNTDSGKYNVGIVFFRNNENGFKCSEFWKNLLLDPDNKYSGEYGKCGDQKYLELFELEFNKVCIIDKLVGHGAPWCFESYSYSNKYDIIYNGVNQKIVYNHFSKFKIKEDGWVSWNNSSFKPELINPYVKEYYEDYYNELKRIKKIYNI